MSQATGAMETVQPVTLKVGDKTIELDGSPLPEFSPSECRTKRLARHHNSISLAPSWQAYLIASLFLLIFGPSVFIVGFSQLKGEIPAWIGVFYWLMMALGLFVLVHFLYGFGVRFDRGSGQAVCHEKLSRRVFPLAEIFAVQIVLSGIHRGVFTRYKTYQLNVYVDNPEFVALNLGDHSDLAWTRRAGKELATFLGVPLIDQIPGTK